MVVHVNVEGYDEVAELVDRSIADAYANENAGGEEAVIITMAVLCESPAFAELVEQYEAGRDSGKADDPEYPNSSLRALCARVFLAGAASKNLVVAAT